MPAATLWVAIVPAPELPPPLCPPRFVDRRGKQASSLFAFVEGARLDPAGLRDLLAWGYQRGSRSLLTGVRRQAINWSIEPPSPDPVQLNFDERADRLWQLLRFAVSEASSAARRPRCSLSGGLDSRAVAAAAASLDSVRFTAGSFGDPDCPDLPVAAELAARLGLAHEVSLISHDAALENEERVWEATSGYGGPASAPGAATDALWGPGCDVLLSASSGDVIWGDTTLAGPSPRRRLVRSGLLMAGWEASCALELALIPEPPAWASDGGVSAWNNLWTRQRGATWDGVRSRLAFTSVVPVPWNPALLSFCLALGDDDRRGRSLLCRMLERNAPEVSAEAVPPVQGPVHDLDRAFRSSPAWAGALGQMMSATERGSWRVLGIRPSFVARAVAHARAGSRRRAGFLSRLRAAWRWGRLLKERGALASH